MSRKTFLIVSEEQGWTLRKGEKQLAVCTSQEAALAAARLFVEPEKSPESVRALEQLQRQMIGVLQ
jgi:hypothetical protein